MEHAEFTAELARDERINEDLKVTVEVTDISLASSPGGSSSS
jgi:hypothetical protein